MLRRRMLYRSLPSEYQELKCIKSNGNNKLKKQFINTNLYYVPNHSYDFHIDYYKPLYGGNYQSYFGIQNDSSNRWLLLYSSDSNKVQVYMGSSGSGVLIRPLTDVKISFNLSVSTNNVWTLSGRINNTPVNFSNSFTGDIPTDRPLFILADSQNTSTGINHMTGDLYGFSAKQDEQYIRNYIPAIRLSDNVVGLYDLCNSICPLTDTPFYINAGSGTFGYETLDGIIVEPI